MHIIETEDNYTPYIVISSAGCLSYYMRWRVHLVRLLNKLPYTVSKYAVPTRRGCSPSRDEIDRRGSSGGGGGGTRGGSAAAHTKIVQKTEREGAEGGEEIFRSPAGRTKPLGAKPKCLAPWTSLIRFMFLARESFRVHSYVLRNSGHHDSRDEKKNATWELIPR